MVNPAECPKCHIIYAKFKAAAENITDIPSDPKWNKVTEDIIELPLASAVGFGQSISIDRLVYKNEHALFTILVVIATIFWLVWVIGTFGLALIYLPLFAIGYLFMQSGLIVHLKGNGVKISAVQFPELYKRYILCCKKLGLNECPDAYLINGSGMLNAFASRFLGRNFVVLYSNVVHGMADHPEALNFYIGHELGHIQRKHLQWGPYLMAPSILPLVGTAYSRAREYTCDQFGRACCESTEDALKGLIALSAGENLWTTVNIPAYLKQAEESSGFWMSFHELVSDYPWLVKRAARIRNPDYSAPSRDIFAWILAVFVPRLGVGGGIGGLLVTVAIVGILAAIAVPQFTQYRMRAHNAQVEKAKGNTIYSPHFE